MLTALVVSAALAAAPPSPSKERPLYYERPLVQADLEGRSLRELSLMRNWIWARGGNTFRKEWLAGFFAKQPWYKALPKLDAKKISATDKKNSAFIAEYETKLPKKDLQQKRAALVAIEKPTAEEEIELRLVSERLGVAEGIDAEDRNPLEDLSMLDKLLTLKQLEDLSPRDLRILRNTVYARHGREFKSPILMRHFLMTDWYEPDPKFTDARLTEVDKKNIQLIKSLEDSLGGPLTDKDMQDEFMSGA